MFQRRDCAPVGVILVVAIMILLGLIIMRD